MPGVFGAEALTPNLLRNTKAGALIVLTPNSRLLHELSAYL